MSTSSTTTTPPPHSPSPTASSSASKSNRSIGSSSKSKADGRNSFTSKMRDRQARNKDPYQSSEESEDEIWGSNSKRRDVYGNESYETVQKRREAAIILDSPELLMMHAQARSDSIPATRFYFTKMLAGFLDNNDDYPLPAMAVEGLKNREREREREKGRKSGK